MERERTAVGVGKGAREGLAETYLPQHIPCLTALFPGLPGWAGTKKAKPIWILLKQETMSGSDISWAICRPDALPAAQQTASKHLPKPTRNIKPGTTAYMPHALDA